MLPLLASEILLKKKKEIGGIKIRKEEVKWSLIRKTSLFIEKILFHVMKHLEN